MSGWWVIPSPVLFRCQDWGAVNVSGIAEKAVSVNAASDTQLVIPRQFPMSLQGVPWFCFGVE